MTSASKLEIDAVLSSEHLRRAWKKLRDSLLELRPKNVRHVQETLANVSIAVMLDDQLNTLADQIRTGRYSPQPASVVRTAKRNRLVRSIVYLAIDDALVLTALCDATRSALVGDFPEWVSMGGSESRSTKSTGYEDWFQIFMRHNGRLDRLIQNEDTYIVTSDISNFFPTVHLPYLHDMVLSRTSLNDDCINLLFQLIKYFGGVRPYEPHSLRGLPIETDDNCRMLANFFLNGLDSKLHDLGTSGKYTRFMDDITFSVPTKLDAARRIVSLQAELETLGLMVNPSKTRVWDKSEYRNVFHPDENAFLDYVDNIGVNSNTTTMLNQRATEFLKTQRSGYWDRILRRYYSTLRKHHSRAYADVMWDHVRNEPELASAVLDYAQVVCEPLELIDNVMSVIVDEGSVYDDLQSLCYETLIHAPFPNDEKIKVQLFNATVEHIDGRLGAPMPLGYIQSLGMLLLYRMNERKALDYIIEAIKDRTIPIEVARQCHAILSAYSEFAPLHRDIARWSGDTQIWRNAHLFEVVRSQPVKAINASVSWLRPKATTGPSRSLFRWRILPVLMALHDSSSGTLAARGVIQSNVRSLQLAEQHRLIDWIAIDRLSRITSDGSS